MQIGIFSTNNYKNTLTKNVSKHISFGELDDGGADYYKPFSKSEYQRRKALINEKYDKSRSSYLNDADDMGYRNSVVWEQLKRIEQMRERELAELDANY